MLSGTARPPSSPLQRCRQDFPILGRKVNERPLIYLDSAATSLKPQAVIDAVTRFYSLYTANVHRAVHLLSEEATEAFEDGRAIIARFINADTREVIFTRHATEAINLVAHSLRGRGPVAMPISEHHSNLLPWRAGEVVTLPVLPDGGLDLQAALQAIEYLRPALVTLSTISSVLGVAAPVAELTAATHAAGGLVMLDLSQSVGHEPVDVQELDCDFACFSGHKMLGPSGVGVLYFRHELADLLRPLLVGGSMVQEVHVDGHVAQAAPWGLEAGTPNIEGVLGLAAAAEYLEDIGLDAIETHCRSLTAGIRAGLAELSNVRLNGGPGASTGSIVSFSVDGLEAHSVARMLSNRFGIMVRSGHLCAQPLHEACDMPQSVRVSVHLYNTAGEVDCFIRAMRTLTAMT